MKKCDILVIVLVLAFFLPFLMSQNIYDYYYNFNKEHAVISGFLKFAILASFGELLGLRIKTGNYYQKGFGIMPRAIVWGVIGITIVAAFAIFSTGVPVFLKVFGVNNAAEAMLGSFSIKKIFVAFAISASINIIYAPVMMTMHKITDTHILNTGGTLKGFFSRIKFQEIISNLNWKVQWNFVFMKTIPFFWIPAHTITFLLPSEFQVLSAALLGIALGVILAIAAIKSKK